jgi:hypothetical protein
MCPIGGAVARPAAAAAPVSVRERLSTLLEGPFEFGAG